MDKEGGIFVGSASVATITNTTITDNTAAIVSAGSGTGAGIYVQQNTGIAIIASSIVTLNNGIDDLHDDSLPLRIFSLGHNIFGVMGKSPIILKATDIVSINPLFDPAGLTDNGGPTETIGLTVLSPAIDAGSNAGSTTDQRGAPFVDIAGLDNQNSPDLSTIGDIGAFEFAKLFAIVLLLITYGEELTTTKIPPPSNAVLLEIVLF